MTKSDRYSFRNLDAWKAAQDLAVDVSRLVDGLPNTRTADVIGRQLLRSVTSIAANIAEGHARFTPGAYRNHLSIAKGSAAESESWLNLLVRLGLLAEAEGNDLEARCSVLMGMLTRRILALEKSAPRRELHDEDPTYHVEMTGSWFPGSLVQDSSEEEPS